MEFSDAVSWTVCRVRGVPLERALLDETARFGTGVCENNDHRHKEHKIMNNVILLLIENKSTSPSREICSDMHFEPQNTNEIHRYTALYDDGRYFRRHR